MSRLLWMGAGVGATLLYKKYNKQIMDFMKKQQQIKRKYNTSNTSNSSS